MKPSDRPININAMARKVDVDNRIPLRNYLRIADNLLKQATIYREEKNIVDLYVILLRFSSLVSETIPFHRDYQALLPKEKTIYRKKLLDVVDELERLKADVHHQVNELNKARIRSQLDGPERFSSTPAEFILEPFHAKKHISSKADSQLHLLGKVKFQSSQISSNEPKPVYATQFDKNFQKRAFGLSMPKEETLSRHSILGPNGLRGQWLGPSTGIKVQYPSNVNLSSNEKSDMDQAGQLGQEILKDDDLGGDKSMMQSVLSLDDGRWLHPAEKACASDDTTGGPIQVNNIWQPPPPPVLAHVHQNFLPISPSKVADPRPGPVKPSENGLSTSNSYQHLHIPVKMMMEFLRLAEANTKKNLETCGVLAGSLRNRVFHITTLIIPKQESTSDSCQTLNEEEIFDVQDKRSLFPLGWIHTHPSQTCFMSSIDLHTHYSYQVMLPEAIAIVMAPTDESSPHGIFHLSDPGGMSTIRNCQQRGFHPHEEPSDGGSIYEHCSHVFMNPNLKFDIMDLRLM